MVGDNPSPGFNPMPDDSPLDLARKGMNIPNPLPGAPGYYPNKPSVPWWVWAALGFYIGRKRL